MNVDLSSLSYFHGQVIADSNPSTAVALKGTAEVARYFPSRTFGLDNLPSLFDIAVAIDEVFLNGLVATMVEDIHCGEFFVAISEGLPGYFRIIGKYIHQVLRLEDWDKFLKDILAGGLAKFVDVVMRFLREQIRQIKSVLQNAKNLIELVAEEFGLIDDVDETTEKVFGQTTKEQMSNETVMVGDGNNTIMVSDGKGNFGYIRPEDQSLITGRG